MFNRIYYYAYRTCVKCISGQALLKRKLLLHSRLSAAFIVRYPFTSDAIPPPTFEAQEKVYAPKIQQLVNDISKLTLVEVADLNELLKKTLKISDVPVMAAPMMAAKGTAEQEDDEPQVAQTKTAFTVRLMKFDESKKVALIKEIKSLLPGMNLVQAKKFVESVPQPVKTDISKEEAEKLKVSLEAIGGTVEVD